MLMRGPPTAKPGAISSTSAGMASAQTTTTPLKATMELPISRPAKAPAAASPPLSRARR